jgi:hypothetical protein
MSFGMNRAQALRGATGFTSPTLATGHRGGLPGEKIPKGYRAGQLSGFTPEQMQLFQSLFSQVEPGSPLSRMAGGEEGAFREQEAPALRQFSGLLGNIASRFSGMGDLGARRSSGFQLSTSQAASDFAQDLQARRQALQRQALLDLMGISGSLLGARPQEKFLIQKQRRPSGLASILGTGLGAVGGGIVGGPAGALMGAQTGFGIGNALGGGSASPMNITGAGLPTSWNFGGSQSIADRLSGLSNPILSSIYG